MLRRRGISRARAYAALSRPVSSDAAISRFTGGGGGMYSERASAPEQANNSSGTRERGIGKRENKDGGMRDRGHGIRPNPMSLVPIPALLVLPFPISLFPTPAVLRAVSSDKTADIPADTPPASRTICT